MFGTNIENPDWSMQSLMANPQSHGDTPEKSIFKVIGCLIDLTLVLLDRLWEHYAGPVMRTLSWVTSQKEHWRTRFERFEASLRRLEKLRGKRVKNERTVKIKDEQNEILRSMYEKEGYMKKAVTAQDKKSGKKRAG